MRRFVKGYNCRITAVGIIIVLLCPVICYSQSDSLRAPLITAETSKHKEKEIIIVSPENDPGDYKIIGITASFQILPELTTVYSIYLSAPTVLLQ